ncbi:MAG: hypothetical protein HUK20_14270 [Fibrobacter sp.]|nr:hypothetical protein [Fibrobacter sp.]
MKEYVKDAAGKEWNIKEMVLKTPVPEQETLHSTERASDYGTIYTSDNMTLTYLRPYLMADDSVYELIRVDTMQGEPVAITVRAPKNKICRCRS